MRSTPLRRPLQLQFLFKSVQSRIQRLFQRAQHLCDIHLAHCTWVGAHVGFQPAGSTASSDRRSSDWVGAAYWCSDRWPVKGMLQYQVQSRSWNCVRAEATHCFLWVVRCVASPSALRRRGSEVRGMHPQKWRSSSLVLRASLRKNSCMECHNKTKTGGFSFH